MQKIDTNTETEFDLSTLKNPALLDFVVAVANAQNTPSLTLRAASGLDPLEINIATATGLEFGVVARTAGGGLQVTPAGLQWASDQLAPARAIFALSERRLAA